MSESLARAEFLTSSLLQRAGFRHGFFTRRGGVSPPPWDSLNLAVNTGDDPARVATNRARVAEALGLPVARLHYPSQVHGVAVVEVGPGSDRDATARTEADATLALEAGVGCGIRSADCGAILVGDLASGAALAVHAGWKGTVLGVVGEAVRSLRERVGSRSQLVAAVGPHLEACCLEVGDDVAEQLGRSSPLGDACIDRSRPKAHVDLRSVHVAQLVAAGVEPSAIDHVRGCTRCDAERFFSFRRDGARSGRLVSVIVSGPGGSASRLQGSAE